MKICKHHFHNYQQTDKTGHEKDSDFCIKYKKVQQSTHCQTQSYCFNLKYLIDLLRTMGKQARLPIYLLNSLLFYFQTTIFNKLSRTLFFQGYFFRQKPQNSRRNFFISINFTTRSSWTRMFKTRTPTTFASQRDISA